MMNKLKAIIGHIQKNSIYWFLAFCMIASALPIIPNGLFFYVVGVLYGVIMTFRLAKGMSKKSFAVYLIICYISSSLAMMFDYRVFVFTAVIIFITPIFNSIRLFEFRSKYIEYCLYLFPVISLICLYCYFAGINLMAIEEGDVSWDFSAIFGHSMWLGAANGISNVVLLWYVYTKKNFKWVYLIWLLASIFLSVVSGSRSALAASLLAMSYLIYLNSTGALTF